MVTQMGMSDKIGNVDLNTDYSRLSAETRQLIDREVRRLIDEGRDRATKLLTDKRKDLDILAKALVEYETLNKEEIERVLRGEKLPEKLKSNPHVPIKLPEPLMLPGFGGAAGDPDKDSSPPPSPFPPSPSSNTNISSVEADPAGSQVPAAPTPPPPPHPPPPTSAAPASNSSG